MSDSSLDAMLHGRLDDDTRHAASAELGHADEAALGSAFTPGPAPDVFDGAYAAVHAPPTRRWWAWGLTGAALAAAAFFVLHVPAEPTTRLKAPAEAHLEATLVVLVSDGGPVRRARPGEALEGRARLVFRVSLPRAGYVALEARRGDGAWQREWPAAAAGAQLVAGEHELSDEAGAVAVLVGAGVDVRVVAAERALDVSSVERTSAQHFGGAR